MYFADEILTLKSVKRKRRLGKIASLKKVNKISFSYKKSTEDLRSCVLKTTKCSSHLNIWVKEKVESSGTMNLPKLSTKREGRGVVKDYARNTEDAIASVEVGEEGNRKNDVDFLSFRSSSLAQKNNYVVNGLNRGLSNRNDSSSRIFSIKRSRIKNQEFLEKLKKRVIRNQSGIFTDGNSEMLRKSCLIAKKYDSNLTTVLKKKVGVSSQLRKSLQLNLKRTMGQKSRATKHKSSRKVSLKPCKNLFGGKVRKLDKEYLKLTKKKYWDSQSKIDLFKVKKVQRKSSNLIGFKNTRMKFYRSRAVAYDPLDTQRVKDLKRDLVKLYSLPINLKPWMENFNDYYYPIGISGFPYNFEFEILDEISGGSGFEGDLVYEEKVSNFEDVLGSKASQYKGGNPARIVMKRSSSVYNHLKNIMINDRRNREKLMLKNSSGNQLSIQRQIGDSEDQLDSFSYYIDNKLNPEGSEDRNLGEDPSISISQNNYQSGQNTPMTSQWAKNLERVSSIERRVQDQNGVTSSDRFYLDQIDSENSYDSSNIGGTVPNFTSVNSVSGRKIQQLNNDMTQSSNMNSKKMKAMKIKMVEMLEKYKKKRQLKRMVVYKRSLSQQMTLQSKDKRRERRRKIKLKTIQKLIKNKAEVKIEEKIRSIKKKEIGYSRRKEIFFNQYKHLTGKSMINNQQYRKIANKIYTEEERIGKIFPKYDSKWMNIIYKSLNQGEFYEPFDIGYYEEFDISIEEEDFTSPFPDLPEDINKIVGDYLEMFFKVSLDLRICDSLLETKQYVDFSSGDIFDLDLEEIKSVYGVGANVIQGEEEQ